MSGIAGGVVSEQDLQDQVSRLDGQADEDAWFFERGETDLGFSYPRCDPQAATVWNDGSRGGVIYGVVTNRSELGFSTDGLFERLFDRPAETAESIEGSFLIACVDGDADRVLLVTDKLGSRPCYYVDDANSDVRFATGVDVLLPAIDEPALDVQAASDLLLMGHMWGDRTLVEQVSTVRPATVLEVTDGMLTTERYWKPDYAPHRPNERYIDELASRYRQAAGRFAGTLPEKAGIWLSGGLDSRTTAGALLEHTSPGGFEQLTAYGYDANPPTNDNPRVARAIADELGIDYVQVPLSAETFAEDFERVIEATDGMISWNTTANLSPSYRLAGDVPVLMEGMQGSLVGDHLLRYHFDGGRTLVETQKNCEASASVDEVTNLLKRDVDPLGTFKQEAARIDEPSRRDEIMDITFQNYFARHGMTSNRVMHDCGGSRVPQVDGDYLEWCAQLPRRYRKGTFPLSQHVVQADAGGVPYGTSIAKLELCRRVCPELADITYERTKTKPARPYPLHVAGFVGNVVINRLRSNPTYGSSQLPDFWIRDTDTDIHRKVTDLVDDAVDRSLFSADAVQQLYADHMDGDDNATMLARVTTLEYWLQEHLD